MRLGVGLQIVSMTLVHQRPAISHFQRHVIIKYHRVKRIAGRVESNLLEGVAGNTTLG